MANKLPSSKRLQIDKANTVMVAALAISSFLFVFSLFASRALLSQRSYQSRVISAKEEARDQLEENIKAADKLVTSYQVFVKKTENVIGGVAGAQGDKDGDNAKIILDALPSKYDYPALTSSLEKLVTQNNIKIDSITGIDDELVQQKQDTGSTPKAVDMPFELEVTTSYDNIQNLIKVFEKSIRPIHVNSITLGGNDSDLTMTLIAKSYYQPEKSSVIRKETIK